MTIVTALADNTRIAGGNTGVLIDERTGTPKDLKVLSIGWKVKCELVLRCRTSNMFGNIGYAKTEVLASAEFRAVVFVISTFADESSARN